MGDVLRVLPGEKVPVDGTVLDGRTSRGRVDAHRRAAAGGEGPGRRGDRRHLNQRGSVRMRAERVGADTLLAGIVRLVGEAQRSRAPVQRLADRVSAIFVPAVVVTAVVTGVVWALVGPEPRLAYAVVNAIAVLIIACPCALGLATPMAVMVGTGRGAQAGVLFRNAEALERLERADTLVIDKTGTLTEGTPRAGERPRPAGLERGGRARARGRGGGRQRAPARRGHRRRRPESRRDPRARVRLPCRARDGRARPGRRAGGRGGSGAV